MVYVISNVRKGQVNHVSRLKIDIKSLKKNRSLGNQLVDQMEVDGATVRKPPELRRRSSPRSREVEEDDMLLWEVWLVARLIGHPPPSSPSNPELKLVLWLLGAQMPLEGLKKLLQKGQFLLLEQPFTFPWVWKMNCWTRLTVLKLAVPRMYHRCSFAMWSLNLKLA